MARIQKGDRVGRCEMCGMQMLIRRADCRTCGDRCRKRLQRKSQLDRQKGEPMIRVNGVNYPARLVNMFSDDEWVKHTGAGRPNP